MATQIEIINRALYLCGVEPIQSLDDDCLQAEVARTMYPDALGAALARPPRWTFARVVTSQLPQLATDSPEGYPRFGVPSNTLAIVRVFYATGERANFRLEAEGLVLVGGAPGAVIYMERIDGNTLEGGLPSYFVLPFSYELASDLALPLTESADKAKGLRETAKELWPDARAIDAQSNGAQTFCEDASFSVLNARS